jgi:hypothetical protein
MFTKYGTVPKHNFRYLIAQSKLNVVTVCCRFVSRIFCHFLSISLNTNSLFNISLSHPDKKKFQKTSVVDRQHFGTDPDPDPAPGPALFVSDVQDANKNIFFPLSLFAYILFEGTFTLFFKDKKIIKSH